MQRIEGGKTFRWKGDYIEDLNAAVTHETQLGVFEHFEPTLPDSYKKAELVLLANINPGLQLEVLDQVENPRLTLCDTMNLWINLARDSVLEVFGRVDIAVLNDGEARMLTEQSNLLKAGRQLLDLGPRAIIIKKGEHGSMMITRDALFGVPAYPLEEVVDPTGAGDTFAGSIMGYLAKTGDFERCQSAPRHRLWRRRRELHGATVFAGRRARFNHGRSRAALRGGARVVRVLSNLDFRRDADLSCL